MDNTNMILAMAAVHYVAMCRQCGQSVDGAVKCVYGAASMDETWGTKPPTPPIPEVTAHFGQSPPPRDGWYFIRDDALIDGGWCLVLLERKNSNTIARTWAQIGTNEHAQGDPLVECRAFWVDDDWIFPDDPAGEMRPVQWHFLGR